MAAGSSSTQAYGLTILRIVVGIVFLMHGYQKFFKMGIHGVTGMFTHLGIPLPAVAAIVVTLVEFVGGILLITGIATRLPAALLCVDMLVAILVVHLKHGFFNPMGYEFPMTLLAACICILLSGGGALSVKRL